MPNSTNKKSFRSLNRAMCRLRRNESNAKALKVDAISIQANKQDYSRMPLVMLWLFSIALMYTCYILGK